MACPDDLSDVNVNHSSRSLSSRSLVAALAALSLFGLSACGSDDTEPAASSEASADVGVEISDAWSRQPADGQTASAVYGVVTNNGSETITAIAASTPQSSRVELHETTMNDAGQMSMSPKDGGFAIAAGESFAFEPGGPHIMLLEVDPATYPDNVDVTLEFDNGTTLDFVAEVREIGDMEMDDDHGGSMVDE